ncbi:hypothetical protein GE09DRAFT_779281 [Coniochaeta sp. 2T2.1]|nr:hypothetical protein GE09DRAFT_779281 [Coniochaeta sp. 2T2.1]
MDRPALSVLVVMVVVMAFLNVVAWFSGVPLSSRLSHTLSPSLRECRVTSAVGICKVTMALPDVERAERWTERRRNRKIGETGKGKAKG